MTEPTELAAGGKEIQFIALDDASVYWTDFALGTVNKVAKAGGAPQVIAGGRGSPSGLTVSHGTVFWTEFSGDQLASRASSGDGPATTLATGQDGAFDVTTLDDGIYWTTFRGCTVASLADGVSKQLDHAKQPFTSIVSSDGRVFWISFQKKSVERFDVDSSTRSTLVNGGTHLPSAIATDGANVYFGETSSKQMTMGSVPSNGGATKGLFASGCDDDGIVGSCLAGIATDGTSVYFSAAKGGPNDADAGGLVRRVPVEGGEVTVVATHQARPFSIAVDDSCVYWSNLGDGSIWAAPK